MSSGEDEVFSIGGSDKSFSGFSALSSEDEVPEKQNKTKKRTSKVKSTVKKVNSPKGKSSKTKKTQKSKAPTGVSSSMNKENSMPFDITKLSQDDLSKLRVALGIIPAEDSGMPPEESGDMMELFGPDPPNLRVEVNRNDISDTELDGPSFSGQNVQSGFQKALFEDCPSVKEDDFEDWGLPQLKAPQKGAPISKSLASMINVACSSQCDIDNILSKYHIPENCDRAMPPVVNSEIWKIMDKRTQSQDRSIVETQNLVAAGITPIIKLAEVLKTQISGNAEAKLLFSDALTLLGQVQFNLSVKRRYLIRPALKKKYYSLCSVSMPVTTQLFGDDVAKDIKACDSMASIGKDYGFRPTPFRGRDLPPFVVEVLGGINVVVTAIIRAMAGFSHILLEGSIEIRALQGTILIGSRKGQLRLL